jgi:hypothetical protein
MFNEEGTHEERSSQWVELMEKLDDSGVHMGLYPSPPDPRDFSLETLSVGMTEPPEYAKLQEPPFILDQKNTPFCGGASGAQALNLVYDSHNALPKDGFSMRFLYWMSKQYDGIPNSDGTFLRTICKVLKKYGVCRERLLRFENNNFRPTITEEMIEDASGYKIDSYAQLYSMREIKRAISMGFPVLIGAFITSKNWNPSDGFIGKPAGEIMGGHAMLLYGYDDLLLHNQLVGHKYGINSWGQNWGDGGKFYMPYDFYDWSLPNYPNIKVFMEAWAVRVLHLPLEEERFFDRPDECPKGVIRGLNCVIQSLLRR